MKEPRGKDSLANFCTTLRQIWGEELIDVKNREKRKGGKQSTTIKGALGKAMGQASDLKLKRRVGKKPWAGASRGAKENDHPMGK